MQFGEFGEMPHVEYVGAAVVPQTQAIDTT